MSSESGSKYYGPFFWLSLLAFCVPVLVGVYALQAAPKPYSRPEPKPDASGVDHGLWDYLLKAYVEHGLVDYDGLARNHLFQEYIGQLGGAQPDALASDIERLALYCNAYNAFVIRGVIQHEISDSVMNYTHEERGFFDLEEHIFAGKTLSLNHIEHNIIRKKYEEPRVHMALVCAAQSCPPIRAEAFRGAVLDTQLEDQARRFANRRSDVDYDSVQNVVFLNAILQWYGDDFDGVGGYLDFLGARVEDANLKAGLAKAQAGDATVQFRKYDWSLNTQGARGEHDSGGTAEFGSGSIPNN
jgi:hypothetical protein